MAEQASRRWSAAAFVGALAAVGVGTAGCPDEPPAPPLDALSQAIQQVKAGEIEGGCQALQANLAADATRAGLAEARAACVDARINQALAIENVTRRELELLALAAPGQAFAPSPAQRERIERETAALPGAIEEGRGRIHPVSYEVHGPISTKPVRAAISEQVLAMRACHAQAALVEPSLAGTYTLRLRVEGDGKISNIADVEGKTSTADANAPKLHSPALTTCIASILNGLDIQAADAPSMVLVELHVRPSAS